MKVEKIINTSEDVLPSTSEYKQTSVPAISAIESMIIHIRGVQVMMDCDLAKLYGVETRRLNEQVKRNIERFPMEFCFQLTERECANLISQNATSSWGGRRKPPYVFTEQGVAMLAAVLKSETAIKASIQIMKAFVAMRHFMQNNMAVFTEIKSIRKQLLEANIHQKEADKRIDELFNRMDKYSINEFHGLFFNGQVFDAYVLMTKLIRSAKKSIKLIDNYIDESVLVMLDKRDKNVSASIFTQTISQQLRLDISKHNEQYNPIAIRILNKVHDRFMLIDDIRLYHIGASIKDLGKKLFAITLIEDTTIIATMQELMK